MERNSTILLIFSLGALTAVVASHKHFGMKLPGKPAIADNERMLHDADDLIVGDSNVIPNPVSRVALSNTRFGPLPGMPPLRRVSRGGRVMAQILNNEAQHE